MSTAARIDELLSKFDENPRRYFAPLANEYRKAGDLTQAIALCREHLPKQPGHMSGHIVFGQALFEHGELAEAQSVFEAALALDPENLIALRHLGDIARGRGDALAARRWYGRVLEADPRNDDIAALLASLPSRVTPIATAAAVVAEIAPTSETSSALAPSSLDEPDWHTPTMLSGPSESVPDARDVRADPELLDLDSPAETMVERPTFFDAAPEVAWVDEAFGAERESARAGAFDTPLDFDTSAVPPTEVVAFEPLPIEEIAVDSAEWSIAPHLDEAPTRDALTDAIGAFASHDPLDDVTAGGVRVNPGASRAEPSAVVDEVDAPVLEAPASVTQSTAYGDGLNDLEWPDTSQLAARAPSPERSATPVASWASIEAGPAVEEIEAPDMEAIASLVDEAPDLGDVSVAVESLVERPEDAEFVAELLPAAGVEGLAVFEDAEPAVPMDDDPPSSAGAMPWLLTTEEEREAEEAEMLEVSELPESPAFVTETMAELLVAQGFVARAVDVYEELVVRRPDDAALALRRDALRARLTPESAVDAPIEPTSSATPVAPRAAFTLARSSTPRSSTPFAVPFIAPAPRPTAREWLSRLAAMQVARRTPVGEQVVVSMPTPADGLASLFGASPLPSDDVAARSLATAFSGAVPLDSSAPLFASGEFTLPPESERDPVRATPSDAANGSSVYSFDRFFPDPATTANGPTTSSDEPAATSPTGTSSDDPTSPGADLAQFSHWLKGLSNS